VARPLPFDDGMSDLPHSDVTEKIIACMYQVHNELGAGFTEKVYRRALALLLREQGLTAIEEARILVHFHGTVIGTFHVDIVVDGLVLVEIKATRELDALAESQILNYLKAAGGGIGLLINFGKRAVFKRRVMGDPNANLPNVIRKSGTPVSRRQRTAL
jgi:GxxExxY protein